MPYVNCTTTGDVYDYIHPVNNPSDCMKRCMDDPNCTHWAYPRYTQTCYTGSNQPTCKPDVDYISGVIGDSRSHSLTRPTSKRESYTAPNSIIVNRYEPVKVTTSTSSDDCKNKCLADNSCNGWIYSDIDKECIISSGNTPTIYQSPGVISGCTFYNSTVTNSPFHGHPKHYLPNIACSASDDTKTKTPDANACMLQCANNPNCEHWSYSYDAFSYTGENCRNGRNKPWCFPESNIVSGFIGDTRTNPISIANLPPPPPFYIVSNRMDDMAYLPAQTVGRTDSYANSIDDCEKQCTNNGFCKGWTYYKNYPGLKNCTLIDGSPDILLNANDFTSGKIYNVNYVNY